MRRRRCLSRWGENEFGGGAKEGLGKVDEKEGKEEEKLWTIGRGRKDSKDELRKRRRRREGEF